MAASSAGGARPSGRLGDGKRPFQIGTTLGRIREAVRRLPNAAMLALAEEGYRTLFEQLAACVSCPVLDMCLQVGVEAHR